MKNEVRPIDTNALNNEVMNRTFVRDITKVSECTCDKKCDHNATNMRLICGKPLTLDQLRGMDGQPVWVKVIGKTGIRCDGWCEVEIREKDPFAYVWWPGSEVEDIAKIEDYGKTWACYVYPPVHIDREAWEPCEECEKKNCDNCLFSEYLSSMEPCKSCCNAKSGSLFLDFALSVAAR